MRDLTQSAIDRQNILNNARVLEKVQGHVGLSGLMYEGEFRFTTKMVADFYDVDVRTIKRLLETFEVEVKHNGYSVLKGQKLREFKELFGPLITGTDDFSQGETDFPLWNQDSVNQSYTRRTTLRN